MTRPTGQQLTNASEPPPAAVTQEVAEATPGEGKREHRYGDGRARIIDVKLPDAAGRRSVSRLRTL